LCACVCLEESLSACRHERISVQPLLAPLEYRAFLIDYRAL